MDRFQYRVGNLFWLTAAMAIMCAVVPYAWRHLFRTGKAQLDFIIAVEWLAALGCAAVAVACRRWKPQGFLLYPLVTASWTAALFATIAQDDGSVDSRMLVARSVGAGVMLGFPVGVWTTAIAWTNHRRRRTP